MIDRERSARLVLDSFFGALRAPSARLVSEWAAAERILPQSSAMSGRWRNEITPYLVEIMDSMSVSNPARVIVFVKPAQIGGSEAGYNAMGYLLDEAPGNIILMLPGQKLARKVSRDKIDPLLTLTPALRSIAVSGKTHSRKNPTIDEKPVLGGSINIITGGSATAVRQAAVPYVVADEADALETIAGEGDPIALIRKRQDTFRFCSKLLIASTPLLAGSSRVMREFEKTDQRHFWIPCPRCATPHRLEFKNLIWEKGRADSARLRCPDCMREFGDDEKIAALGGGEWRASKTGREGYVGFKANALMSPFLPLADIAGDYDEAFGENGDETKQQVFINTVLGDAYKPEIWAAEIPAQSKRAKFGADAPAEALFCVAGIDTQDTRAEIYVYGIGLGERMFAVDFINFGGDKTDPAHWRAVWAKLRDSVYQTPDGRRLRISAVCIDSGGGKNTTAEVYDFVARADVENARLRTRRAKTMPVWAIKGIGGFGVPLFSRSPHRVTKGGKVRPTDLYRVGVDSAKTEIYKKISAGNLVAGAKWASGGAVEKTFWSQLTSEERREIWKNGRPNHRWILSTKGRRNEALDCAVYAYVAAKMFAPDWELLARRANVATAKAGAEMLAGGKPIPRTTENDEVAAVITPPPAAPRRRSRPIIW